MATNYTQNYQARTFSGFRAGLAGLMLGAMALTGAGCNEEMQYAKYDKANDRFIYSKEPFPTEVYHPSDEAIKELGVHKLLGKSHEELATDLGSAINKANASLNDPNTREEILRKAVPFMKLKIKR